MAEALFTQPMLDAMDTMKQLVQVEDMGRFVLYTGPQGKGVKDGGDCIWRWWWGTLRRWQHILYCHTEHREFSSLRLSFSGVSFHEPLPPTPSFSLHASPSLSSSACRHTLIRCMSPYGVPACHFSIYLKEGRFNRRTWYLLMHIYPN